MNNIAVLLELRDLTIKAAMMAVVYQMSGLPLEIWWDLHTPEGREIPLSIIYEMIDKTEKGIKLTDEIMEDFISRLEGDMEQFAWEHELKETLENLN